MNHKALTLAQRADRAQGRMIAGMVLLIVTWMLTSCATARPDRYGPRELGQPIHVAGK